MAVTRLYLIRHAHSEWRPDEARPLSANGRRDAVALSRLLAASDIAAIYSSPARRALQTIEPLAKDIALIPTALADLRERELPVQPGDAFEKAVRAAWLEPERAPFGGETNRAAQVRGVAVIDAILVRHAGENVAVATHGNLLALILGHFDPTAGYSFWRELSFPDVYELAFTDGRLGAWSRVWNQADGLSGSATRSGRRPGPARRPPRRS